MQSILDFGIRLITGLQALGDWQILPMKFFSFLGTEEFFMMVLPVLYWCINTSLGMRVAVILMLSGGINDTLKMAFHQPRPYWLSSNVTAHGSETSFGIPSGHSQNSMVIWGALAAGIKKGWAWAVALVLIFFVGLSRLSLGLHFPQDVLLGWLVGALLLLLVWRLWNPVTAWAKKQSTDMKVRVAFLGSLALVGLPLIPFAILKSSGWQAPAAWASFSTQALSLEGAFTNGGTFFGLMLGSLWLSHLGGFKEKGPLWKLALRYLLGVAGVLAIRYGLKYIFPEGETFVALSLRYLRYAIIGFWVTGGAPWAFLGLKLAEKRD